MILQFINSSKYTGDIVYTPVDSSQGFWSFTANGYSIGGQSSTKSTPVTGIADTGTTFILLDNNIVQDYWSLVQGSVFDGVQYTFPCNANLPNFEIVINGETRTGKSFFSESYLMSI
jgi:aspergillopepsin I